MAKKKKKMTAAQAAAARRDDRPRRRESNVEIKDNGPKDRGSMLVAGVTIVMVVLITIISFAFSGILFT